ncbi:unnamed protein product [Moneuplotes crassus]|uniref:Uncharacterized protein n=1 Tax=Euplotes crassus TaxID=5936 RepID=A0AAD2CYH5_EUPCR|nr:unnamed protein product [Moneuplotes crassus]
MKPKSKELKRSPIRKEFPAKKSYKPKRMSETIKLKDSYQEEYKTQALHTNKEVVEISFESELDKTVPMSSESSIKILPGIKDLESANINFEKLVNPININQPKLKRIFNFHIKSTHNKIEFSEFLKFCKSTQIFPNFISIIYLKKIIQEVLEESKSKKGKRSPRIIERTVSNNTQLVFKDFNRSIKSMAKFIVESSPKEVVEEKIRGFIKHINVNCQYSYNVNNLISDSSQTPDRVETPVKAKTPQSFASSTCDHKEDHAAKPHDATYKDDLNEKTTDSNMIDENINKALEALKNPRLSCPQSSEKQSSGDSSKLRDLEDLGCLKLDQSAFKRHASNGLQIGNPTAKDNPFKRYRSTSRGRKSNSVSKERTKEKTELEEFLALEKSCKNEPSSASSNIISINCSPRPQHVRKRSRSNKHSKYNHEIHEFDTLGRPDSINPKGLFKRKREVKDRQEDALRSAKSKPKPTTKERESKSLKRSQAYHKEEAPSLNLKLEENKSDGPKLGEGEKEDPEDYDKKLQEIQEKYKKALNLQDAESNLAKKKVEKPVKDLFSADEYKTLKSLVTKEKPSKATKKKNETSKAKIKPKEKSACMAKLGKTTEVKISKRGGLTSRSKTKKYQRSNSINRRKDFLTRPKEKKLKQNNSSKPRNHSETKGEDLGLDSIKNSILKIKEKALKLENEVKPSKNDKVSSTLEAEMRAYVSISSIDLCNAKDKDEESRIMEDFQDVPKDIPTFSLHQEDKPIDITSSDTSNLTSKEPESHHPSGSKYKRNIKKVQGNKTLEVKPRYHTEMGDLQTDFLKQQVLDPLTQNKSLKSLKASKGIEIPSKTSSLRSGKEDGKKNRTVRFKEGEHLRQNSGINLYKNDKIISEEEKHNHSASKILQFRDPVDRVHRWNLEPSGDSEETSGFKQEIFSLKSDINSLDKDPKPQIELPVENMGAKFPSITNLRANITKKEKRGPPQNSHRIGVQDYVELKYTNHQKLALKLTFKNLESMMKLKQKENVNDGFKKIKEMNNLCREYRSQMLLSLTKLFSVIKHKQTIQKAQVLNTLSTKVKMEALADSLANDATSSLKGLLMDKMKNMM